MSCVSSTSSHLRCVPPRHRIFRLQSKNLTQCGDGHLCRQSQCYFQISTIINYQVQHSSITFKGKNVQNLKILFWSPFTFAMVRREAGAVVGTLEVEDRFQDGITYCRIDSENVVSRWIAAVSEGEKNNNSFVSDISEHLSPRKLIQVQLCVWNKNIFEILISDKKGFLCSIVLSDTKIPWSLVQ